jgi:predicted metal-dependent peptidase
MSNLVEAKLAKCKTRVVLRAPFFASILLGMELKIDDTLNPPTAATNGKTVFVHPDAVERWTPEELCGVLVHETCHVALLHPWRRGMRERKKANYAMDYAINPIILEAGFSLPPEGLDGTPYKGMSFEAIYAQLPDPPPDDGSGQGGQSDQFDDCMDAPGNEQERQESENEAKLRITQAANQAKSQGALPASLAGLVDQALAPKVDWRQELRRYMTQVLKNDQSWNRGQRRFLAQGMYLPALHNPGMGRVVVGIDTSGSIVARVGEFLDEVQSICDECKPECVTVIQCDARVTAIDDYADGEVLKADVHGGGGTDMREIYKAVETLDTAPAVMVLLTDGQTPWPDAPPDYPHITVTTDDECPYGDNIKLD